MAGVVCERCGTSNREGLRFCENCDRFLGWDGTTVDPEAIPAVRPQIEPPEAAPPVREPTPIREAPPVRDAAPRPAPIPAREPVPLPIRGPASAGSGPSGPRHAAAERSGLLPPAGPSPPRPTARLLPVPTPAGPTSTICPNCGLENDQSRRFCRRCGQWRIAPSATAVAPPATFTERWRRRWFGDRGPYSDRLSQGTVGFRTLVAGVVLVVVIAILAVANQHPIQRVKDQIGHVRGTGRVPALTAIAQPTGERADPTAEWAVDGVRARGWSTQWTATTTGDPDAACRSETAGPPGATGTTATSLEITFPRALDVREIGFEAGLVKAAERTDRWRPKTLELRWKNGECQSVNLEDTPDLQRFRGRWGPVGGVLITVVAGYPPVDRGSDRLDLGEVTIWQR